VSSHREAPEISKDPVADSTDVYAFVSPDRPDTVTIISNYIPLEGPAGTPNYAGLATAAVRELASGETVFAGQRNDGFFVDLGAIFDLGDIRPLQNLHLISTAPTASVDTLSAVNVHT